jgi:hypothetical protein
MLKVLLKTVFWVKIVKKDVNSKSHNNIISTMLIRFLSVIM